MKEKRQRMSMSWPYSIYDSNFAASIIQAAAVGAVSNLPEISAIASVSCRYSPMIVPPSPQKYFPYLFQRHLNLKLDSPDYDPQRSYLRLSNHCASQPFLCHPTALTNDYPTPSLGSRENTDTSCQCGIINCVSTSKINSPQTTTEKSKSNAFLYPSSLTMEISGTPEITKPTADAEFLKNDISYKSYFTT